MKGPYTQKALQHYEWVEGKTTLTCLPEIQKIYHNVIDSSRVKGATFSVTPWTKQTKCMRKSDTVLMILLFYCSGRAQVAYASLLEQCDSPNFRSWHAMALSGYTIKNKSLTPYWKYCSSQINFTTHDLQPLNANTPVRYQQCSKHC